jgi:hypothetical protein
MPSKVLREELIMLIFLQTGCLSRCNCSNGFVAIYARRKAQVAVPTTVHCDHLIQAKVDAVTDLEQKHNNEVLIFFLQCLINTELVLKPGLELFIR